MSRHAISEDGTSLPNDFDVSLFYKRGSRFFNHRDNDKKRPKNDQKTTVEVASLVGPRL